MIDGEAISPAAAGAFFPDPKFSSPHFSFLWRQEGPPCQYNFHRRRSGHQSGNKWGEGGIFRIPPSPTLQKQHSFLPSSSPLSHPSPTVAMRYVCWHNIKRSIVRMVRTLCIRESGTVFHRTHVLKLNMKKDLDHPTFSANSQWKEHFLPPPAVKNCAQVWETPHPFSCPLPPHLHVGWGGSVSPAVWWWVTCKWLNTCGGWWRERGKQTNLHRQEPYDARRRSNGGA